MADAATTQVPCYEAAPEGKAAGGVVVVQEAFGVTPHIESVCRRFAAAGWHAVAPHLFHRAGDPVFGYDFDDEATRAGVMRAMGALTGETVLADVDAALGRLAAAGQDPQRTGIVGFCMGGTVAMFAAANRQLGAAVTFYGGGVLESRWPGVPALVELAPALRTPWLGLYGDADQGIPVEQVERLRAALADARVPTELVRYPAAGHGFHCDERPSYHPDAAADAWQRTLDWFRRHAG